MVVFVLLCFHTLHWLSSTALHWKKMTWSWFLKLAVLPTAPNLLDGSIIRLISRSPQRKITNHITNHISNFYHHNDSRIEFWSSYFRPAGVSPVFLGIMAQYYYFTFTSKTLDIYLLFLLYLTSLSLILCQKLGKLDCYSLWMGPGVAAWRRLQSYRDSKST